MVESDEEVEREESSPLPATQAEQEEDDEIVRAMKVEVGQSLDILASVLQEIQAKEEAEAERARAKAKQRAKAVARASAPIQTAERYDPTKPDAHMLEVGPSYGDKKSKMAQEAVVGRGTTSTTTTTSPLKERAIETDLSVLSVIFRNREEGDVAPTPSPAAALVPQQEGFSFGFSLGGSDEIPTNQEELERTSNLPSIVLGSHATDGDEDVEEESQLEEQGPAESGIPWEAPVAVERLVLWPTMEELEETASKFFESRHSSTKGESADRNARDEEAWKVSRQMLMKDFKRKRRSAIRMRKSIQKKGGTARK